MRNVSTKKFYTKTMTDMSLYTGSMSADTHNNQFRSCRNRAPAFMLGFPSHYKATFMAKGPNCSLPLLLTGLEGAESSGEGAI